MHREVERENKEKVTKNRLISSTKIQRWTDQRKLQAGFKSSGDITNEETTTDKEGNSVLSHESGGKEDA